VIGRRPPTLRSHRDTVALGIASLLLRALWRERRRWWKELFATTVVMGASPLQAANFRKARDTLGASWLVAMSEVADEPTMRNRR
jgi:hypothetical protein